jgi:UDP-GlcNAc:undecaprenyl-phosphate/decaprenyl-phosphate GlcNAc-1-phosphate transferase
VKTSIASFLLGFVVAVWLTPLVRRMALRHKLVDRPEDGRRIHHKRIPRVGGLAIAAAVLTPILALAFYENVISHAIYRDDASFTVLLVGALAALAVGLADDLFRPPAKLRLLALIAIAVLTWFGGYRLDEAQLPLLGEISMGHWSLPVTVLWIVGVIVAINFVDGLDGLATGIALISTVTLFVCAQLDQNTLWMTWTGAMAGALLGFLIFNFNPASIFMGDAGSNFLGYLLAVVALQTSRKHTTVVALVVPLCVLGLPLLDVTLTMVRRALLRRGLFTSERGHLHHRLLHLGLSHREAVLVLYAVSAVLCLGAVLVTMPVLYLNVAIAGLIATVVFALMFATGYVRPRDLLHMYRQGKENEALARDLDEACQELAQSLEDGNGVAADLPELLGLLVKRGCVSAVRYRCKHACELVVGEYDASTKGSRLTVPSGSARQDSALVFWKGRTTDPSPREVAALRNLFAGVDCSCEAAKGAFEGPVNWAELWGNLIDVSKHLDLITMRLTVHGTAWHEGHQARWDSAHQDAAHGYLWSAKFPLMVDGKLIGHMEVTGRPGQESFRQKMDTLLKLVDYFQIEASALLQARMPPPAPEPRAPVAPDAVVASLASNGHLETEAVS